MKACASQKNFGFYTLLEALKECLIKPSKCNDSDHLGLCQQEKIRFYTLLETPRVSSNHQNVMILTMKTTLLDAPIVSLQTIQK